MEADELARLLAEDAVTLVDVRTPAEFAGATGYPCDPRQGHIEGAVNLPVEVIVDEDPRPLLIGLGLDPTRPIVAYCHSGQRSEVAAALFRSAGLDAVNYEGSWHEWSRRGD